MTNVKQLKILCDSLLCVLTLTDYSVLGATFMGA